MSKQSSTAVEREQLHRAMMQARARVEALDRKLQAERRRSGIEPLLGLWLDAAAAIRVRLAQKRGDLLREGNAADHLKRIDARLGDLLAQAQEFLLAADLESGAASWQHLAYEVASLSGPSHDALLQFVVSRKEGIDDALEGLARVRAGHPLDPEQQRRIRELEQDRRRASEDYEALRERYLQTGKPARVPPPAPFLFIGDRTRFELPLAHLLRESPFERLASPAARRLIDVDRRVGRRITVGLDRTFTTLATSDRRILIDLHAAQIRRHVARLDGLVERLKDAPAARQRSGWYEVGLLLREMGELESAPGAARHLETSRRFIEERRTKVARLVASRLRAAQLPQRRSALHAAAAQPPDRLTPLERIQLLAPLPQDVSRYLSDPHRYGFAQIPRQEQARAHEQAAAGDELAEPTRPSRTGLEPEPTLPSWKKEPEPEAVAPIPPLPPTEPETAPEPGRELTPYEQMLVDHRRALRHVPGVIEPTPSVEHRLTPYERMLVEHRRSLRHVPGSLEAAPPAEHELTPFEKLLVDHRRALRHGPGAIETPSAEAELTPFEKLLVEQRLALRHVPEGFDVPAPADREPPAYEKMLVEHRSALRHVPGAVEAPPPPQSPLPPESLSPAPALAPPLAPSPAPSEPPHPVLPALPPELLQRQKPVPIPEPEIEGQGQRALPESISSALEEHLPDLIAGIFSDADDSRILVGRTSLRGDVQHGDDNDPDAIDTWIGSGEGAKLFSDVFSAFLPGAADEPQPDDGAQPTHPHPEGQQHPADDEKGAEPGFFAKLFRRVENFAERAVKRVAEDKAKDVVPRLARGGNLGPLENLRSRLLGEGKKPAATATAQDQKGHALDEPRRLDALTLNRMEGFLQGNFNGVRVHTGKGAEEITGRYGADAVTVTDHIFFAPGKFNPNTLEGERLIAHELTHVLQKGRQNLDVRTAESEALGAEHRYGTAPQMETLDLRRPAPDFKFAEFPDGEGAGLSQGTHTAKRTRSRRDDAGGKDELPDGDEFLEKVSGRVYELLMEELEESFESR